MEGANVTISYKHEEEEDAQHVEEYIKKKTGGNVKVVSFAHDLRDEAQCEKLIEAHLGAHGGKLDLLCVAFFFSSHSYLTSNFPLLCRVLNHGTQMANTSLPDLPSDQWRDVFATNIHSFFYLTKRALPHMPHHKHASIIFNASVNPSVGHPELVDYTATKGAIVGFARALSNQIVGERGIRVNCVAPGPIWTPLM